MLVRDDIIVSLLSPLIYSAFDEYHGRNTTQEYGLWSTQIIEAKRLDLGQFYYEVTLQGVSYGDKYSPPHTLETITIRKDFEGTHVVDYKSESLPSDYNIRDVFD